ncbi:MAG: 4Fe-4S dicluster domain-containing protein [Bacillota bacterium]
MHRGVFVRYERCLGCRSCQLACAVSHTRAGTLAEALLQGEAGGRRLFVDQVGAVKAPSVCRHCEEAYCVAACPAGAMWKRPDGVVTNAGSLHQCVGCWMCVMACPFGVISRGPGGQAVKCDQECLDGDGLPACVKACPTRALVFTTMEEFEAGRRRAALQGAAATASS